MGNEILADSTSLAVWDVPMPAIAGETFSVKVGAKSASGRALKGSRIEVSDATGAVVASGTLGDTPWTGTEALVWTALDIPAPAEPQVVEYSVRFEDATSRFSVAAMPKPEHTLSLRVIEEGTAKVLADVEVRIGPFRARTDAAGHATLRVSKGEHRLALWRHTHDAKPRTITVTGDASLDLAMTFMPEDHPDVRWVG